MGIIKTIKGWIYKIKHFDALEKQCKMLKSELNDVIRLNYNAAEHPIDHLHSVLCDFDFNIVFDPQPEYAKVVNYPYSKLIGNNGIRSIDIIKKIE